jgi:hypothetical protein
VGVPLLLGSHPRRLAAISHQPPTLLTADSGLSHNGNWLLYNLGTDRTENVSSIIACSVVAGETTCLQSCSLATAVILSPVYTAVTWQWVYMPQYTETLSSEWLSTVCTYAIRNGFVYTCSTYTKFFPLCHILDSQRKFSAFSTWITAFESSFCILQCTCYSTSCSGCLTSFNSSDRRFTDVKIPCIRWYTFTTL